MYHPPKHKALLWSRKQFMSCSRNWRGPLVKKSKSQVSSAQQAGHSAPGAQKPPSSGPGFRWCGIWEETCRFVEFTERILAPWLVLAFLVFGRPLCLYAMGQTPGECQALETYLEARFYFNRFLSVQQKPRETKELTAPGQRQNFAWKASSYFSVSSSSRMERGGVELWQRWVKWTENKAAWEGKITTYFFFCP